MYQTSERQTEGRIDRQMDRDRRKNRQTDGQTNRSADSLHMPGVGHSAVGRNVVTGLLVELVASVGILSRAYTLLVNVRLLVKTLPRHLFGNTQHILELISAHFCFEKEQQAFFIFFWTQQPPYLSSFFATNLSFFFSFVFFFFTSEQAQ